MLSFTAFAWTLALLATSPSANVAVAQSTDRSVDDPRACPWDIKICGDGTWVYRRPERDCAFGNCWVRMTDDAPATFAPTKYEGDSMVLGGESTLPPEPTPEGEEEEEDEEEEEEEEEG